MGDPEVAEIIQKAREDIRKALIKHGYLRVVNGRLELTDKGLEFLRMSVKESFREFLTFLDSMATVSDEEGIDAAEFLMMALASVGMIFYNLSYDEAMREVREYLSVSEK